MANPKLEVVISAQIDQLQKGLATAQSNLSAFSAEASTKLQRVGDAIKSVAIPAGIAAAALGAMGLSAVRAYGRLEALEKGLAAVAGSTEAAKSQLNDLREVAKLPGLGLEEAVRGSISLQAIGISADVAKNAILQFGNAVATVGKGRAELDRALYGLQQLANTDFPLGEDLNIIKDAIPQVSRLLDEAFGANRSDALAKMGVTSQQVVDVILKGLGELPRVTGGVANAFENMQDSLTEALQEVGKAINESLNFEGALSALGDKISELVVWFRNLSPVTKDLIVYIGAGTTALLGLVAAAGLIITIAPRIAAAWTMIGGPIALIATGVAIAAGVIIANWDKVTIAVRTFTASLLKNIGTVIGGMARLANAVGASNAYALLSAAQMGVVKTSQRMTEALSTEAKARFDASNAAYAEISTTKLSADTKENLAKTTDKAAAATKRLGLEIWKLNGIQALNGKELDRKKFKPAEQIGSLDRGTTIGIPQVQITGIITDAQALAIEAADTFNEFFSQNLGSMIGEGLGNIASGIGNAIAEGGNVIEAFGKGILDSFGKFLSEFGKRLIDYGIAAGAFAKLQLAMTNPVTALIAAPLAIAAGAALMIAGAAATRAASGGSVGGQGSQTQNYTSGTVVRPAYADNSNELKMVLRNGDLMAAVNYGVKTKGR